MENKKAFSLKEVLVILVAMVLIATIAVIVALPIIKATVQETVREELSKMDDSDSDEVSEYTEKARESRDAANIRAAIAEVSAEGLSTGTNQSKTVQLTQDGDFEYVGDDIGGEPVSTFANAKSVTVHYDAGTGSITFTTG